jgi:hypothetical protein
MPSSRTGSPKRSSSVWGRCSDCRAVAFPLPLARAYAALGDVDRGLEWLRRAFEERTIWLCADRVDEELAPLRVDPRYAALEQQVRY